jgi:imidazolonepropionase-like amidohydrolase
MGRVVFVNATVFDGADVLTGKSTVVVEGERIGEVTGGHVAARPGDQVFDLQGRTLMPGMIECHFHPDYRGFNINGAPMYIETRPGVLMATTVASGHALLATGFTGYVGAGCANGDDQSLKAAVESGIVMGPRVRCSSGHFELGKSVESSVAAVNEQIDAGAEIIKIFTTGGHGTPAFLNQDIHIDPAEIAAVCQAAKARGAAVRAHCVYRDPIIEAIESGITLIDHGDEADETCLRLMAQRGVFWVPSAMENKVMTVGGPDVVEPVLKIEAVDHLARIAKNLPIAIDLGVKILLGDDFGIELMPHEPGSYGRELTLYANELGCGARNVLTWATRNGAELLGLPGEAGTIAQGAFADIVVTNTDPLRDITIFETPRTGLAAVMKGGEFFRHPDRELALTAA